jgi:tetratricopeptide (TPR) repeat protein
MGKHKEALQYLDKALELDPNNVFAISNKGFALHNMGKHKEALQYLDKALELDPNNDVILRNKKLVQEKIKN